TRGLEAPFNVRKWGGTYFQYETLSVRRICPARGSRVFPTGTRARGRNRLAARPRPVPWHALQTQQGTGRSVNICPQQETSIVIYYENDDSVRAGKINERRLQV